MAALTPAAELAAKNPIRHPNESDEYRRARQALLVEEIELRRHAERVASLRRDLPPGGEVPGDYHFVAEDGADVTLADLFGEHDTLVVYSYMFGPQREAPCPMCTSLMGGLDHKIADIRQRVAIAFTARSPIERLIDAKTVAWVERSARLQRRARRLHEGLRVGRRRRHAGLQRVHPSRRRHPPLLERRDHRRHGRPRPGSTRRRRDGPAVAPSRHHPRRPWNRLVPPADVLRRVHLREL